MTNNVKSLMETCPAKLMPDMSIKQAVNLLVKNDVKFLPVVDESDVVVGALSETDLMKLIMVQPLPTTSAVITSIPKNIIETKVVEVMNKRPVSIVQSAEIREALNLMNAANVKALIVTDDKNKVVGILKLRKIIKSFVEKV